MKKISKEVSQERASSLIWEVGIIIIISGVLLAFGIFPLKISWIDYVLQGLTSLAILLLPYHFVLKKMIK